MVKKIFSEITLNSDFRKLKKKSHRIDGGWNLVEIDHELSGIVQLKWAETDGVIEVAINSYGNIKIVIKATQMEDKAIKKKIIVALSKNNSMQHYRSCMDASNDILNLLAASDIVSSELEVSFDGLNNLQEKQVFLNGDIQEVHLKAPKNTSIDLGKDWWKVATKDFVATKEGGRIMISPLPPKGIKISEFLEKLEIEEINPRKKRYGFH